MGITDRRYMSEPDGSFGTIRGRPVSAVWLLILVNVAVWIAWQFATQIPALNAFMETHFLCTPSGVFQHFYFHTLLTSAFSQIEPYHILFNMLFLYWLGVDVEAFYDKKNFVVLYIVAGVVSSLAQCGIEMVRGEDIPSLGASGSVMGIAVVAAFLDPHKKFLLMFFMPIPLWLLVGIFVLMDVSGVMRHGMNVAHAAHLGGALTGFLFYRYDWRVFASRGRSSSGMAYRIRQWWRGRKFRVVRGSGGNGERARNPRPLDDEELVGTRMAKRARGESEEPVFRPEPVSARIDPETAKRVDELLAKISRDGMEALSSDEREFLRQSSEKYKR